MTSGLQKVMYARPKMQPSKKTPRNTQDFVDYRLNETEAKIDAVDAKIDTVIQNQRDTVVTSQLTALEIKIAKTYVTKVEYRPVAAFFKFWIGVLGVVVAAAFVAFLNFIINGGLSK